MGGGTFNPNAPIIALRVRIKGRFIETAVLAIDTGATYVMIPWRLADALGLNPERASERAQTITADGIVSAPLVTLESTSALGVTARNVKAIVHDLPERARVDGLLGLSFLRNFNLHLNFSKGEIKLE